MIAVADRHPKNCGVEDGHFPLACRAYSYHQVGTRNVPANSRPFRSRVITIVNAKQWRIGIVQGHVEPLRSVFDSVAPPKMSVALDWHANSRE